MIPFPSGSINLLSADIKWLPLRYITSYESPPSLTKIMKIFWKKWKNCHVILHCVVLNGRVWYFMVLGCIDTVDVILSWVTGPGAGMTESIKWVPAPNALTMLTDLNQKSWEGVPTWDTKAIVNRKERVIVKLDQIFIKQYRQYRQSADRTAPLLGARYHLFLRKVGLVWSSTLNPPNIDYWNIGLFLNIIVAFVLFAKHCSC